MAQSEEERDQPENVQIGLSLKGKDTLNAMQRQRVIGRLVDGYRLAVAIAIAKGYEPVYERDEPRENMYHYGDLDPDHQILMLVTTFYPQAKDWPVRAVESLACQGVEILATQKRGETYYLGGVCPTSADDEVDD